MKILITGSAGFIGYHLAQSLLLDNNIRVIGIDNINDYYDTKLKKSRLANLKNINFSFYQIDISDKFSLDALFADNDFDVVVNLAAQAGVRYSITHPEKYIESNILGFNNILEACRKNNIKNLVYASSSSVYGMNSIMPFSEDDEVNHPISLYAATKKSNELMAHTYSHLYDIPTTGLRFFTVYGPWGRPDMAYFSFTKSIIEGKPIKVFNNGNMMRDFTYIDDIVDGIKKVINDPAKPDAKWNSESPKPSSSLAPYRILNLGNNNPIPLNEFIKAIEEATEKDAIIEYLPMQPGDVEKTYANIDKMKHLYNFKPATSIRKGINNFVDWYTSYHG
jgi:UDP-glucuronate 4-epimerase|tara:strand:- start:13419 stop:14423 length:1005 start_codon:yes stop_codon:yes gene_type:complete